MTEKKSSSQTIARSSRIYLRVLLVVLILSVLTVLVFVWAINSKRFAIKVVNLAAEKASSSSVLIKTEKVSGTIFDGLEIQKVIYKNSSAGIGAEIENVRVKFDMQKLKKLTGVQATVEIKSIRFSGAVQPEWLKKIPPFPGISCLAALPANIELSELKIGQLDYIPFDSDTIKLSFSDIVLGVADQKKRQKFDFECSGFISDRSFLTGHYDGSWNKNSNKAEGRFEGCLGGKKLVAETIVANKHGKPEFSGHLAICKIDLVVLSRWLMPLWQDRFPFGFDGTIEVCGSWVYNPSVGFVGNLSGFFRKVRMVAQGLFVTIFELNGSWLLYNGNLEITDKGSSCLGFPAIFEGSIDSVLSSARKFDIAFKADDIDLQGLYENLPWSVKYGMGLPQMTGNASFSFAISGKKPRIRSTFTGQKIGLESKTAVYNLDFELAYDSNAEKNDNFIFLQKIKFVKGQPGLFARFRRKSRYFDLMTNSVSRLESELSGSGNSLQNFSLAGNLKADNAEIVNLTGSFHDGSGVLYTRGENNNKETDGFVLNGFSFLQLLLAY